MPAATPKGWRLHIYVKERPTIREIDYVGLRHRLPHLPEIDAVVRVKGKNLRPGDLTRAKVTAGFANDVEAVNQ